MVPKNQFRMRPTGEYETANLCIPFRFLALMLNRIFDRSNGKYYKISWVPVIYFVATQGTIFNWADIISNILYSCISAVLGGISQTEFYMSSCLIDCILCIQEFPALNCQWDKTKNPVYSTYQLFWAHKYFSHYKSICEDFIMPLYKLNFLT